MIRVTIFDDNQHVRDAMQLLIEYEAGFEFCGAYKNCQQLYEKIKNDRPDVVVMDIDMPGINGIEAVKMVSSEFPRVKVLMLTSFDDDEKVFNSIVAGACGYVLKNTAPSKILEYIRETFEGGAPLSPSIANKVLKMIIQKPVSNSTNEFNLTDREKDILSCLVKGMSYKAAASECFISIDTVRGHIRNIYDKLHVHSKSEAVATAIKRNIV